MARRYEPDIDGLYDIEEVFDIIQNYGIEGGLVKIDIDKVPDRKLRQWLEQYEKLGDRIKDHVFPKRIAVTYGKTRHYKEDPRKTQGRRGGRSRKKAEGKKPKR